MSKGILLGICKSCGNEIVEFSNDGVFGGDECQSCERSRYESHPAVLAALTRLVRAADAVTASWAEGRFGAAVRDLMLASGEAKALVAPVDGVTADGSDHGRVAPTPTAEEGS